MSCCKSCKKWRNGILKSLKILFSDERNSGEVCEGYIPFFSGASKYAFRRITRLPSEHENKLVEYCVTLDQRYCGLRHQDIKRMAFQLAIRNGLKHPFNQEKSAAGKKWFLPFLKRHPVLSL